MPDNVGYYVGYNAHGDARRMLHGARKKHNGQRRSFSSLQFAVCSFGLDELTGLGLGSGQYMYIYVCTALS